jgi:hypothetical protein
MKKGLVLVVVALVGIGTLGAAEPAISVLDIEPGVQALGLGGAAAALAKNAETLYYNPAGLAGLAGISFNSSYAMHLGLASYSVFGLTFRNWGIGLLTVGSGDIPGYDEEGGSTDPLSYGSTAVLFGFGVEPSDLPFLPRLPLDFAVGGRIKYLSVTNGTTSGSGFSFDLAYRMNFPDMRLGPVGLSDLALGAVATNLFGSLGYEGGHSESLRMDIRLGGSAKVAELVLLAADLELGGSFHLGAEYKPIKTFAIRAGVLTQAGGLSITLGLGLDVAGFVVDYAFASHPSLGGSHRISLTVDFSALDLRAIGRSLGRIIR